MRKLYFVLFGFGIAITFTGFLLIPMKTVGGLISNFFNSLSPSLSYRYISELEMIQLSMALIIFFAGLALLFAGLIGARKSHPKNQVTMSELRELLERHGLQNSPSSVTATFSAPIPQMNSKTEYSPKPQTSPSPNAGSNPDFVQVTCPGCGGQLSFPKEFNPSLLTTCPYCGGKLNSLQQLTNNDENSEEGFLLPNM